MLGFTSQKMTENRGLLAHPTPPVGVTILGFNAAPSSSGQDAALSRLKHGFDSRRGHQLLRDLRQSR